MGKDIVGSTGFVYVRNNPLKLVDKTGEGAQLVAAAVRWQKEEARKTPEQRAAERKEAAGRAKDVAKGAKFTKWGALGGAFVAAFIPGGQGVSAGLVGISRAAGATEAAADIVAAQQDPSPENVGAVLGDLAGQGTGAGVQAVGNALWGKLGQPVLNATTAYVAEGHADLTAAAVTYGATSMLGSGQEAAPSGGDDTSVDRAIADKEARARKGPERKPKD